MIICPKCYGYDKCKRMGYADAEKCVNYDPRIKPMTNFDRIKAMSVEELAALFTAILHERDVELQKQLANEGIASSLIELSPDIQTAIHKDWLESEVDTE